MYQRLVLVGNLGRGPDIRYTPQGTAVSTFHLATSRKYETSDGTQKEETIWFRVSVWGKQAETVNQYLSRGRQVLVEGALVGDENGNPKIWTGQDGKPRASFEVRAATVRFLGKKSDAPSETSSVAENAPQEGQNDDIPF